MGVYTRFKKQQDGFRALVELLESTPVVRRQRMIEVGMAEDATYTEQALQYMFKFEDILSMPDAELAELMAFAPPRTIGLAIKQAPKEVQSRFLRASKPAVGTQIKDYLTEEAQLRDIGGAQLKLVEFARQLEKRGLIQTKKIPLAI